MPARKRKPVEANDGSYGGEVLGAFDRMRDPSKDPTFEERYGPWICAGCGWPHDAQKQCLRPASDNRGAGCKLEESCGGTKWRECTTDDDHICGLGEPCFGCYECEEG